MKGKDICVLVLKSLFFPAFKIQEKVTKENLIFFNGFASKTILIQSIKAFFFLISVANVNETFTHFLFTYIHTYIFFSDVMIFKDARYRWFQLASPICKLFWKKKKLIQCWIVMQSIYQSNILFHSTFLSSASTLCIRAFLYRIKYGFHSMTSKLINL